MAGEINKILVKQIDKFCFWFKDCFYKFQGLVYQCKCWLGSCLGSAPPTLKFIVLVYIACLSGIYKIPHRLDFL